MPCLQILREWLRTRVLVAAEIEVRCQNEYLDSIEIEFFENSHCPGFRDDRRGGGTFLFWVVIHRLHEGLS